MLTSRLTHCDYNQKASQRPVVKEVRQHGFLHLVDIETPPPLYLHQPPWPHIKLSEAKVFFDVAETFHQVVDV